MGVALSTYKLPVPDREFLLKKEISSQTQYSLADLEFVDELGSAKSTLRFRSFDEKNEIITYDALHFSDTIKHPVRVFIDDIEDSFSESSGPDEEDTRPKKTTIVEGGYQQVYVFEVMIKLKTQEIFVFTKTSVAKQFIRRFKKKMPIEGLYFDLSKIDEIPELDNVWGAWQDGVGRCKKKAFFGTEIHKEDDLKKEKITSYNIELQYSEKTIDLFISNDRRISSKSGILTNADLLAIYQIMDSNLSASSISTKEIDR